MPKPTLVLIFGSWVLIRIWSGTDLVASAPDLAVYIRPGEVFCATEFWEYPTTSLIGCAAMCLAWQCHAFFYEDGNCTLTGLLTAPSIGVKSDLFRKTRHSQTLTNIALNKPTTCSRVTSNWDSVDRNPYLAVDGDDGTTLYFQASHSRKYPWWTVDIGQERLIGEVQVKFNGNGSDSAQFNNIEIRVGNEYVSDGNFSTWGLLAFFLGQPPYLTPDFLSLPGTNALCGRYISIKKLSSSPKYFVSINEVKVFALEPVSSP
ncbi:uncharacterized protein [Palaemon carinicauda]|uniref:uncharacterized protein n=1 Tax=Palaemon carinicauda TaxID=392227 RepID=UPI0035B6264D